VTAAAKTRPTRAEIQAFLDCIGLGSRIDPEEWFRSTLPEIFQVTGSLAAPGCGFLGSATNQQSQSSSGTSADLNSDAIPPGTFELYRGICVELNTGDLTEMVTLRIVEKTITRAIFREGAVGGGVLGPKFLWGAPNVATTAVNSLFPFILDGDEDNDHISVRFQSAVSNAKEIRAVFLSTRFSKQVVGLG